jgi:hypothetical protein
VGELSMLVEKKHAEAAAQVSPTQAPTPAAVKKGALH